MFDSRQTLREETVLLVNRVAHIVHSAVVDNFGAPNKNIGDAFLVGPLAAASLRHPIPLFLSFYCEDHRRHSRGHRTLQTPLPSFLRWLAIYAAIKEVIETSRLCGSPRGPGRCWRSPTVPCEATSAPSYRRTSPAFPSLGDIQISCLLPQTSEHRQRHHSDRLRVVQPVRLGESRTRGGPQVSQCEVLSKMTNRTELQRRLPGERAGHPCC